MIQTDRNVFLSFEFRLVTQTIFLFVWKKEDEKEFLLLLQSTHTSIDLHFQGPSSLSLTVCWQILSVCWRLLSDDFLCLDEGAPVRISLAFTDVYHQGLNTSYWYLKAEREKKTRRWKGKLLRSIETLLHVYWITVNSASHSVDGNNIEQKRGASFLLFKRRKRLYSSVTKVLKTTIY